MLQHESSPDRPTKCKTKEERGGTTVDGDVEEDGAQSQARPVVDVQSRQQTLRLAQADQLAKRRQRVV